MSAGSATTSTAQRSQVRARVRAGAISLVLSVLICAGKFAAYWATGSISVFSDAMESIVNIAAGALLLYSLVVAARPADRDHPYGHGKVEYFSAGFEGALIAFAAAAIIYRAGLELARGPEVRSLDVGLAAMAGLALVNGLLGVYLIRTGRSTNSLALIADGKHVLTDVVTSVGVIVGLAIVWATGLAVIDPLVAIVIALLILRTGFELLRSAVGRLMDEADESVLAPICETLEKHREPSWIDVHSLRAWRSGEIQHTDLHLSVPRYFDAETLHRVNDQLHDLIIEASGHQGDVIVHFDPCRPRQCPACAVPDCPVRHRPFVSRRPIDLEGAVRGDEALDTGAPLPSGESH